MGGFVQREYYSNAGYIIKYEKPIFPFQYFDEDFYIPTEDEKDDTEYETIEYV